MGRIDIQDLQQSEELDREAMRSVVGGGAADAPLSTDQAGRRDGRIVDYPPGFARLNRPTPTKS